MYLNPYTKTNLSSKKSKPFKFRTIGSQPPKQMYRMWDTFELSKAHWLT